MSTDFDLEKLFLPAWAQESASVNQYAKYQGDDRPSRDRKFDDRAGGRRPQRRDGGSGGGGRPGGQGGGPGRDQNRGGQGVRPGGPRRDGGGPRPGGPGGPRGDFRRDDRGGQRRDEPRYEKPAPLPEVSVTLTPDDKGVDSLSRQIKISGRSFPLFDIAQMILQKPERQQVRFEVRKKPDGTIAQPLFLCAVDDTLWLSEEEALEHVLSKHFGMFYQAEKTPTDPPKGTYTFVAQCGISGIVLGPPNYHDYQNQLHKLHTERFSRMPFDAYKARVKIVREEAVVKKWIEDQSTKTEYVALNVAEPLRLPSREAVNAHFRETHLPNIIKQVEKHTLSGPASRLLRSPGLQRLMRAAWEEQKRFPLQIATVLSQQFAGHGLQFFKVNKTITHVSVARPHYLDLDATPVSEQVKQIVQFINATPKCTRRSLIEKLAPSPAKTPATNGATETPAAAPAEGAAPAAAPTEPGPTPEQASLIGDLHWLIHQGHVIEFANGILETAKKPAVRPPKPPKAEAAAAAAPAATPEATAADMESEHVPASINAEVANESTDATTPEASVPASAEPESPAGAASEPTAAGH